MCCTDKELAAEGKKLPTDRWFSVKHQPCCIPDPNRVPERETREREMGSVETSIPCDRCQKGTYKLLRTLSKAERHGGEDLPHTLCELKCGFCGNDMVMIAEVVKELAQKNGGHLLNV